MSLFKKRRFKRFSAVLIAALLLLQMLLPAAGVSAGADYALASDRAYTWLKAQQDLTAGFALDGLVDSFDDWWNATDRVQKVYTYDQAVAAIAFMLKDDRVRAEKVLSKMAAIQDPDGSWINSYWWNGFGEEIRKHVGPTAWMVMAYMMYEKKYGATTYQPNVKKALDWAVTFQKPNGGISGGRTQWDVPNTWTDEVWTSTEHNEDMYPVLKYYANVFPDRTSTYNTAATNVKSFLDNVVWNDTVKRWNGGWKNNTGLIDPSVPMDVNPWGVLALGLTGTRDYKQAIAYVDNANGTGTVDSPKYVQTLDYDGQGHMMTAYDFDWEYDCAQATTPTGQPSGLKCADIWLEGTAFMSTVHYMNGNVVKANSILDEMIKKQGTSGTLLGGLPYSLKGSNNNYWQMAQENCVSSTGWLIIAIARYNPFTGQYLTASGLNISSLNPTAGPAGTSVTVSGSGFGATQGTSTVKFGTAAAAVTGWSNTSITAAVPAGISGSVNVNVTVGAQTSNSVAFNVSSAPTISGLNPVSGAAGTAVTISGANFGSAQGTSTVKFGTATATVSAWSNTSITATVPSGLAAGSVNVAVTVNGTASNASAFTVTSGPSAPAITGVTPSSGPVGTSVTIVGTNFGATQGTSTVKFGTTAAAVTTWSNTSIQATVPSGLANGSVNVVVAVGGINSNNDVFNVTAPPAGDFTKSATETSSNTLQFTFTPTSPASYVILHYQSTSLAGGAQQNVNMTDAGNGSWTYSVSPLSAGNSVNYWFTYTKNGLQQPDSPQYSYTFTGGSGSTAPVINTLNPTSGPVGTSVTIAGANFGATQGTSSVKFGSTAATVTSWSAASITATVPGSLPVGSENVAVTVGGVASATKVYTVTSPPPPAPSITSLNPTSGPAGTSVTVAGVNFGATQGTSTVKFGATTATVTAWSATSITATVPSGLAAGAANVTVTVGGTASNASAFTVTTAPGLASNVLFARSPGALSFTAGAGATNDTITAAGGNYDGVPHSFNTYTISGINATYDSLKSTAFNLFVDAGTNVGDAVQVQVVYDFTGGGTQLRTETYNYFATNNVAGLETYSQAQGLKSATGTFANMTNGKVTIKVWNAIGATSTTLRVNATAANGSQSTVAIPFK